jgi:hypothetical protein
MGPRVHDNHGALGHVIVRNRERTAGAWATTALAIGFRTQAAHVLMFCIYIPIKKDFQPCKASNLFAQPLHVSKHSVIKNRTLQWPTNSVKRKKENTFLLLFDL